MTGVVPDPSPPPARLRVVDADAPNARVVGSSLEDSALVVTRGLLSRLDREETQAVVAHVVGSAGNGDPRLALVLLSVVLTLGLTATVLAAPYDRRSRRAVGRLAMLSLRRREREEAAASLQELLLESLTSEDLAHLEDGAEGRRWARTRTVLALPFLTAYVSFWLTQQLVTAFLLGPLLALLWRSRRHLADATAVQLTRYPDSLARAVRRLA